MHIQQDDQKGRLRKPWIVALDFRPPGMPSIAMSTAVIDKGKQKATEEPRGFVPLDQDDASSATSHSQHSQSDSSSDSEDSDSGSSDSSSDSDSEEDITPEYLQSLLNKARQNVREEARRAKMLQEEKQAAGFGEEEIIKVGGEEEEDKYVLVRRRWVFLPSNSGWAIDHYHLWTLGHSHHRISNSGQRVTKHQLQYGIQT
jgi:hypothetical protein